MKVKIDVPTDEVTVLNSQRTGRPYGRQRVGLSLPGQDYPVPVEAFVPVENGVPSSFRVGTYTADAEVLVDRGQITVNVSWRSMKPDSKLSAKAA